MPHNSEPRLAPSTLPPEQLLRSLRRAQAVVSEALSSPLAHEDLRPIQHAVLDTLIRHPGMRQSEASAALGIARTNFVPLFDTLERRGLAERRDIAGDRRARGLFVTDAGVALLSRVGPALGAAQARLERRLGADGAAMLLSLLGRLADSAFDPADTPSGA